MGCEVIKIIVNVSDMILFGVIECQFEYIGKDIGEVVGCGFFEVLIFNDL